MYYLRRRHGRKPQQRRETPQAAAPLAAPVDALPDYPELHDVAPPRPVVITKPKRSRLDRLEDEDCKPAGTFRAGTLHIARVDQASASHGKH